MNQETNNDEKEELVQAVVKFQSAFRDQDQQQLEHFLLIAPSREDPELFIKDNIKHFLLKDPAAPPTEAIETIAKLGKDERTLENVFQAILERKNSVGNTVSRVAEINRSGSHESFSTLSAERNIASSTTNGVAGTTADTMEAMAEATAEEMTVETTAMTEVMAEDMTVETTAITEDMTAGTTAMTEDMSEDTT